MESLLVEPHTVDPNERTYTYRISWNVDDVVYDQSDLSMPMTFAYLKYEPKLSFVI
jgi:hypothetical protein